MHKNPFSFVSFCLQSVISKNPFFLKQSQKKSVFISKNPFLKNPFLAKTGKSVFNPRKNPFWFKSPMLTQKNPFLTRISHFKSTSN